MEYTSVRLSGNRLKLVQFIAESASYRSGVKIRKSNIINFLIDNYCNTELAELIAERRLKDAFLFSQKKPLSADYRRKKEATL